MLENLIFQMPIKLIAATVVSTVLGLTTLPAQAQSGGLGQGSSVLEQLESRDTPAHNANGQVDTDIHPEDVIHWTLAGHDFDPATKKLTVTLALTTERQFTIYEDKLKFEPSGGWSLSTKSAPKTTSQFDAIAHKDVNVYTGGGFNLVMELSGVPDDAAINITYVGCTTVICLFPHVQKIQIPWTAPSKNESLTQPTLIPAQSQTAGTDSVPTTNQAQDQNPELNQNPTAGTAGTVEEQFAQKVKAGHMSLAMLLLIAFVGGLLTNLTPCVAPMIPITIRLLAHQTVRPLASSAMYALGIVATYTALGVVAAMSGALFGNLIAHPAVSITFGLVMFVLGLNMLGFGDLSRLQQIGGKIGSAKGGAFNAFLMGAGAGLVASPCTGPILAALLTYTAGRQSTIEAIGLLGIYSVGFALPYVFLGASAARISKMRVNFHIQILTKLIFASVMFALSLYFMRIPLYGLFTALRPYWGAIGSAGIGFGIAFSAVVIFKESFHHKKSIFLAPTLLTGVGLFFGIQALTRETNSETLSGQTIHWLHSEKDALDAAAKSHKPIIADAWAEWCEACKKMDVTTFADPDVIAEINQNWIPLKFDLTEMTDSNAELQERYELPGLPTMTLLPPSGNLKSKIPVTGYASAPMLLDTLRKNHDELMNSPVPDESTRPDKSHD